MATLRLWNDSVREDFTCYCEERINAAIYGEERYCANDGGSFVGPPLYVGIKSLTFAF